MNTHKAAKLHNVIFTLLLCLGCANVAAETHIAVLDFELKSCKRNLEPARHTDFSKQGFFCPIIFYILCCWRFARKTALRTESQNRLNSFLYLQKL